LTYEGFFAIAFCVSEKLKFTIDCDYGKLTNVGEFEIATPKCDIDVAFDFLDPKFVGDLEFEYSSAIFINRSALDYLRIPELASVFRFHNRL